MKKLWFFIYVMVALFLCNAKVYATENLADGNTANYILLGQAAQNEYSKYEKAEEVTEQPTTNDVPTSDDTSKEDTEVTTETDTTNATSTSIKGTTTRNRKISLKKSKVKKVVNKINKKIKLTFKKIAKATNYQVKISKTKKFSKKKTVTKLVKKKHCINQHKEIEENKKILHKSSCSEKDKHR